jgi:hypothetical protein
LPGIIGTGNCIFIGFGKGKKMGSKKGQIVSKK